MSEYLKKKVLDWLKTMERSCAALRKIIPEGRFELAHNLINEMQKGAVNIGGSVDDIGKDLAAVRDIERFCELVYNLPEKMQEGTFEETLNQLEKLLDSIREKTQWNIPVDKLEDRLGNDQQEWQAAIRKSQMEKEEQYEKQVSNLIPLAEILAEAAGQVKQEFLSGNMTTAKQYLVGMQEAAISLGTSLDCLIGEGSVTVTLLEQYCELLWNCNNAERAEDGLALAEVLCEAANLIAESFAKETRRKKTILLLPKRGSEWPLFEPYWQEAKQNGDKVIVIPVPCYEKHYNGIRGEVIYGEEKYPEYIEITEYSEYNYTDRLADLMVVLDDYNDQQAFYSVHPFFYIDNLELYTKKVEIIARWDGGVSELEHQTELLLQMVAKAKKSRQSLE